MCIISYINSCCGKHILKSSPIPNSMSYCYIITCRQNLCPLISRIWQRWWDSSPLSRLYYKRLHLLLRDSSAGLEEVNCHVMRGPHGKKLQLASGSTEWPKMTISKKTKPQLYNHKEPKTASNHMTCQQPFKTLSSRQESTLASTMVTTLWYSEQSNQNCSWTPDVQEL